VADLNDINDIRNGVFVSPNLYHVFDLHRVAILKPPNLILDTADIPPCHQRTLRRDTEYPPRNRYTLQWLDTEDEIDQTLIPNNSDAAFGSHTELPKPSDLLLHYNYGVAAVKRWGRGREVLQARANPPRPPPAQQVETGTSRSISDRWRTAQKRKDAQSAEGDESESQAEWDEYDVVLYFWANTEASKERRRKKLEESTRHMEQWREAVDEASV